MVSNWSAISWWVIVQLYHGEHMLHSMWWCPLCTETTTLKIDFWNVTQTCLPTRTHYPNANPSFLLLLNIAYLAKKQQIPILQSSIWPDWFSIIIMYESHHFMKMGDNQLGKECAFQDIVTYLQKEKPTVCQFLIGWNFKHFHVRNLQVIDYWLSYLSKKWTTPGCLNNTNGLKN